ATASLNFSPDSQTVVYTAKQNVDEVYELFSVPITGGTPVRLNAPLVPGGDVVDSPPGYSVPANTFMITPDGTRVVYRADQDTNDVIELYSVPIGGGTPVKLNGPLADRGPCVGADQYTPGTCAGDASIACYYYDGHNDYDDRCSEDVEPAGGPLDAV